MLISLTVKKIFMLIFNTTYKVSSDIYNNWIDWMHKIHLPFMLESSQFSNPQIAKIVGSEDEGGSSFSVQFQIENMETLMEWHKSNASAFQNNCSQQFGNEVIFFSTVLEIIE